jgi:hypothetical protein
MSRDPLSTGLPASPPAVSVAEQYGSFAEYALSTEAVPRPASTSLDVARFHAYTGEISFSTDPRVRLYLDGGTVYHAERDGDPSISQVLRDLGVVRADQLERGMVRVGDVDHLGRLFDREPSIDRDAVMVVMESRSEAIVRELANRATASVSISAYRHHPTGIHRWFVTLTDPAGSHRPVSAVAQVDRSVVDELPALHAVTPVGIERSEPDPTGAIRAVDATPDRDDTGRSTDEGGDDIASVSEFQIRWPDGTAEETIAADDSLPPPTIPASLPAPGPAAPSFSIAPLEVDSLPDPDAAVPDDVAAAVKRALEAIENASAGPASVPELAVAPVTLPELHLPEPSASRPTVMGAPTAVPAPRGFAPPTPDMRAEAVYARAAMAARTAGESTPDGSRPVPGQAPAESVEDRPAPEAERRGALRRLIASLRHKGD